MHFFGLPFKIKLLFVPQPYSKSSFKIAIWQFALKNAMVTSVLLWSSLHTYFWCALGVYWYITAMHNESFPFKTFFQDHYTCNYSHLSCKRQQNYCKHIFSLLSRPLHTHHCHFNCKFQQNLSPASQIVGYNLCSHTQ